MSKLKNRFYQFWLYFKAGRNEIGLLYGIVNTLILASMKWEWEISLVAGLAYSAGFVLVASLGGFFLVKEVVPQNNLINPFAKDGLYSAIQLQKSLLAFYEGDKEKAIELVKNAIQAREKWLK